MPSTGSAGRGGPERRGRRSRGDAGGQAGPVPGSPADAGPDADPASVARTIALRKLAAAPRTRAQLADTLARKGVPDEVTDATLDRFEELGLVDDAEYARQWARSRQAGRGLGRRALAYELRQRGVDDELVKTALDDPELSDELETARDLVRRRLAASGAGTRARTAVGTGAAAGAGSQQERQVRRLLGMLARKGYGAGVAARAVREALGELEVADLEPELD